MNKEKLTELIYENCRSSIWTSRQVVDKILDEGGALTPPTPNIIDELVEVIKKYKNSGKGLSDTVDKIYSILFGDSQSDNAKNSFGVNFDPGNHAPYLSLEEMDKLANKIITEAKLQQQKSSECSAQLTDDMIAFNNESSSSGQVLSIKADGKGVEFISLSDYAKEVAEDTKSIAEFLTADINKQLAKDVANKLYRPDWAPIAGEYPVVGKWDNIQKNLAANNSDIVKKAMKEVNSRQKLLNSLDLLSELFSKIKRVPDLSVQDMDEIEISVNICTQFCQKVFDRKTEELPAGIIIPFKIKSYYTDKDGHDIRDAIPQPKIEYNSVLPGHVPSEELMRAYLPKERPIQLSPEESRLLDREVMREKYARGEVDFVTRMIEVNQRRKLT